MIFTASDVESLSRSLRWWEMGEYVSAVLVTVACAGEYAADFADWITGGVKERKEKLAKRSTVLLIAALSLELICLVRTNQLSGSVIGSLGDKADEADRKARKALDDSALAATKSAGAVETASHALALAGESESHLAIALPRAADAEREAARLRGVLADRQLTDAQVKSIADKLRPYAGQEYEVIAYWDSKESMAIAERINGTLQAAEWKFLPLKEWHGMFGGIVGVLVWTHPEADDRTKEAAAALVGALLAEGLQAEPRQQSPKTPKSNTIGLSVGSKR